MAMLRSFINKLALPLLCLLVLGGCGPKAPKVDGTSAEAYQASIEKIMKDMTEEDRLKFRKALSQIGIQSLKLEDVLRKPPTDPEELKKALQIGDAFRAMVNGKTVPEVLEMGAKARAERGARQAANNLERKAMGLPQNDGRPKGMQSAPGAQSVLKPGAAKSMESRRPGPPTGASPAPAVSTPAASTPIPGAPAPQS